LRTREVGNGHRHTQQLLLEEWHAKGAIQHWLQGWMRVSDFLLSLPPQQIRIYHLADDGTWADDGHLYHKVVKPVRLVARQRGHLRTALDLEHADGVGPLHSLVNLLVFRQLRQVNRFTVMLRNQLQTIMDDGHHAQTEQIHLNDAEVGTVLFVPLNNAAARHRSTLQWYNLVELSLADHHAAGVLAKMAWQILNAHRQLDKFGDARMLNVKTSVLEGMRHGLIFATPLPQSGEARQSTQ